MNNKILGNSFEDDFAKFLSKKGYWVAPFPGKNHTNSQPADLIACKNDKAYLIDCKTLNNKNGLFNMSRLEENQRLAYKKWKKCGNKNYYISILWNNDIYLINLDEVDFNNKSIMVRNNIPYWRNFYE